MELPSSFRFTINDRGSNPALEHQARIEGNTVYVEWNPMHNPIMRNDECGIDIGIWQDQDLAVVKRWIATRGWLVVGQTIPPLPDFIIVEHRETGRRYRLEGNKNSCYYVMYDEATEFCWGFRDESIVEKFINDGIWIME
jgi:hypothetical protein